MSTQARVQRWMSYVPEAQQVAEAEELVLGVENRLEMLDTKQGDIALEPQF